MGRAIFRGPTRAYEFTDQDVEWLARSMWGEASTDEGRIAVAWSHINRFLLVRYRWLTEGWPFRSYVQGHSQPINPGWLRDGEFCRVGGKYHGNDTYCSEAQLLKREKYQRGTIPADILALAEDFANGEYDTPFAEPTYDFAACWLTAKQGRPSPGISLGGNCHLNYASLKTDERGAVVPGDVRLEGGSGLPPREIVIPFAGVLIAGIGGLIAWRLLGH